MSLFSSEAPLGGPFDHPAKDDGLKHLGPMQRIKAPQRCFNDSDLVDYALVGVGSAGGVLVQRLARAGFKVIGFEAGPFWDTERQWVSDEAGSRNLYWNDLRITGGKDPLALGSNNSGKGVGGGSVHWASFVPRLHPSDFEVYTRDGVGADWPIDYEDIEPYYELLEREMPVAGPAYYPWGKPHGHPYGPHPMGEVGNVLIKGCTALGIPVSAGGPVAILSASHGNRPHCIYRGFCIQGCKVGAKASTLITHVPDALAHGAEIRDNAMVSRIGMGKNGSVNGVHYFDAEGIEHFQRARAVIVCGYALETPRLLFNSACPGHEFGLANSSGTLGKYLMAQAGNVILGRFDNLIRQYKAPPAHALTEEFYETDPKRDFARGFAVQTVGPLPIAFAKQMMTAKGLWGWGLRRAMMDYNHWSPLGLLGEILPWEDNRIEVADGRNGRQEAYDKFGLPVAQVTFSLRDNDKRLIEFGKNKVMDIMRAAGATEVVQEQRYAHLVGGARMSATADTGVCDKFGRTWDVPNLFVMDGSVFPTQGSANPGLTIQALAARTADYLLMQGESIFTSKARDLSNPPCRRDLSPT
ncbi:GMC family oxidoreductase [Acidicapsa ligni]|uniref:GMC family oxidoreductase n=1 Tax=Acidicapsa ligni TaxID=542300 RepID=UPI0021E037B5|nr:GMC family oxidoreductase [Acidicapsa ligni]